MERTYLYTAVRAGELSIINNDVKIALVEVINAFARKNKRQPDLNRYKFYLSWDLPNMETDGKVIFNKNNFTEYVDMWVSMVNEVEEESELKLFRYSKELKGWV